MNYEQLSGGSYGDDDVSMRSDPPLLNYMTSDSNNLGKPYSQLN